MDLPSPTTRTSGPRRWRRAARFARHWVHNGFVEVGGEKMSKSLGNFTDAHRPADSGPTPAPTGCSCSRSHYRSPIEVTRDTLADADTALGRLDALARRVGEAPKTASGLAAGQAAGDAYDQQALAAFAAAMEDDLDTPGAVALTLRPHPSRQRHTRCRPARGRAPGSHGPRAGGRGWDSPPMPAARTSMPRPAALVRAHDEAHAARDWARSDALRVELQERGWVVEDTRDGTKVRH